MASTGSRKLKKKKKKKEKKNSKQKSLLNLSPYSGLRLWFDGLL